MRKEIEVGSRTICLSSPIFVVAECGVTCNYDVEMTKQLIDVVGVAGADAIKLIFWFPEEIMSDRSTIYKYRTLEGLREENMFDMLSKLQFALWEWEEIKAYADSKDVILFSTVNSPPGIDWGKELDLDAYKLSSWDYNYHSLYREIAKLGKPMILDTGPVYPKELAKVLSIIEEEGNDQVILVHTFHTGILEQMNMTSIPYLATTYDCLVGYSPPSIESELDFVAVALGATMLEKRLTLDRSLPGHHHIQSMEPGEFELYVKQVRDIQTAIGGFRLEPSDNDLEERKKWFRHLVPSKDLPKGHILTEADLEAKRGESGISPVDVEYLIGRKLSKSVKVDETLHWEDL